MVAKPLKISAPHPPNAEDDLSIEYPFEDGERLAESEHQYFPLTNTVAALHTRFRDRPDVYVIGNMLVYYRMNDTTVRVAPDVFVVFGITTTERRYSWFVWREGKAPDFVLEVASPGTSVRDRIEKRDIYARMGVVEYWRYNPIAGARFATRLIGERLADDEYPTIPTGVDASGILRGYSPILGVDLCVQDGPDGPDLRLYDPVSNEWLHTLSESEDARRAAEDARRAAEDALQAAEQENARLRELVRHLQGEPDET